MPGDGLQDLGKAPTSELYPFYKANIHEDRFVARLCRAFPLAFFATICSLVVVGLKYDRKILLVICAILNLSLWLWLVSTAVMAVIGTFLVQKELDKANKEERTPPAVHGSAEAAYETGIDTDRVHHIIVIPNYKEEEELLEETLGSLAEANDSHLFHIVLAMEEREMLSDVKGARLQEKFQKSFAKISVTCHPEGYHQVHNDGTSSPEIPGKASNLRWALHEIYADLSKVEHKHILNNAIMTIIDADCIFHPGYFSHISKEYNILREKPGGEHEWTMWQAPQLSFRNHWGAPICSRAWTYISSMYEFGGVTGLHFGGFHMVFSGYSTPLQLAYKAQSWDGDVVVEDHHCFLKNFFYSLYVSAKEDISPCQSQLKLRPVFLPVKSAALISPNGYWATFVERWFQAKRHMHGVAELSYALLATYDTLASLPFRSYSFSLFYNLGRVLTRLVCMTLLPICQTVGLGVMSVYWLYWNFIKHESIPGCSIRLSFVDLLDTEFLLCGLAGTWTLVWPVVVPLFFMIVSNYCFVSTSFITPAKDAHKHANALWYKEDGDFVPTCGSRKCAAFFMTAIDCCCFMSIMMVPYGLLTMLIAFWNVAFHGNHITYVTASKQTKASNCYGTLAKQESINDSIANSLSTRGA